MKITYRLVTAICLAMLVVVGGFTFLQIREERTRLVRDRERRAALLGEGLKEAVDPVMGGRSTAPIERILKRFGRPNQVIAVYDQLANPIAGVPDSVGPRAVAIPEITESLAMDAIRYGFREIGGRPVYVSATPIDRNERPIGALAVILDASQLAASERALWRQNALRFAVLAVVLWGITVLLLHISVTRPMAKMAEWTKALKTGRAGPPPEAADAGLFGPLALEVSGLARRLYRAQEAAEQEAALRLSGETVWTEERLKQFVNLQVGGPIFVVSNREPVSHVSKDGKIVAQTPASGLVTAMDPVLRACGGVWVAHGSGNADRATADELGRLAVPVDDPRYTLRRVWLTPEEEHGYYYSFANEGLWPLCHIVHVRPQFSPEDWEHYKAVNRKFALALIDEMDGVEAPLVLIQDYHFALLPAYVKEARPDARVAIFWHIPWPNFEAFGICPWQTEILQSMLGADLIV